MLPHVSDVTDGMMPVRRTICCLAAQLAPRGPPLRPVKPRTSDIRDARYGRLVCAAYNDRPGDGWGFLLLPIALVIGFFCFLGCFYTIDAGSVALTETFGAVPVEPICCHVRGCCFVQMPNAERYAQIAYSGRCDDVAT